MTTKTMIAALVADLKRNGYDAVEKDGQIEVQDPVMVLGTGGQANRIEFEPRKLKADFITIVRFVEARK
jgi:hypothetical protein